MVVVSGTTRVDKKKITAGPEGITATDGGGYILFLLKVPEIDVFTLQMEHEVNIKELSWWWKATARMAKKNPAIDNKTIFLIRG